MIKQIFYLFSPPTSLLVVFPFGFYICSRQNSLILYHKHFSSRRDLHSQATVWRVRPRRIVQRQGFTASPRRLVMKTSREINIQQKLLKPLAYLFDVCESGIERRLHLRLPAHEAMLPPAQEVMLYSILLSCLFIISSPLLMLWLLLLCSSLFSSNIVTA